ncbi:MAG: hypothetical protein KF846_13740 [Cyclobacteriaceae bacterium]|nr:hypothetical protein [Cyclobacteriaceae bacterium]MBX2957220.1 hypothetical protein [Cyclobacteriaceae bacterium]
MINVLKRKSRIISTSLLLIYSSTFILPPSYALTSGPTQPEVHGFQPAGTTEMVDLFSGDFVYNIPLFELPGPNGGYPFNLSYQAGIAMDQEASWVGLGWSLQPGAITRQMRGLPDEFNGDQVFTKTSIGPSVTVGLGAGIGVELFGGDASLGVEFGIQQNNYKGMGYSIDANIGIGRATSSGMTAGLGLSLNSKEGIGVNPSLSLGGKLGQFGLSTAYHSKQGLLSISLSHTSETKLDYTVGKGDKKRENSFTISSTTGTTISLAHPGYTPQVSMPMKNLSFSATLKAGGAWWGVFGAPYVTGFYSEQRLKNDRKRIPAPAYGYLNYQKAQEPFISDAMLDFNREKDGMVARFTPNLGIPMLTYDIYSVTGQGIGMMYRPSRNDIGVVYDPTVKSESNAVGVGVDVAPAASHGGVNLSLVHSNSESGRWSQNNPLIQSSKFQSSVLNKPYEPWYFKVRGETVSESINNFEALGGDRAVRVRLGLSAEHSSTIPVLENKNGGHTSPSNTTLNQDRKSRNHVITPITVGELVNASGEEVIPYFKTHYFDSIGQTDTLNRKQLTPTQITPDHHITGYTALTADGLRYVYGLPAYNLHHEEVLFSTVKPQGAVLKVPTGDGGNGDPQFAHNDTEKLLKRTELPPYAHSHLLTAIIGPDYVDVTNDGVTEDDLGYWVKFTYKKITNDFQWRDPFSEAHFIEGWKTDPRDDKGSFSYGKKQIWYLARAETKSHIADFTLGPRNDGKGVYQKLQNDSTTGQAVNKLSEIRLYSRFAGSNQPIKVTRFEYDHSLCKNIYGPSTTGKLTLKKVWFEYGTSSRGSLNPYQFTYHSENPAYDLYAFDRWGMNKPYPQGEPRTNHDFPYTDQNPANKTQLDNQAAAWSLKEIVLPSGGKIIVDYEVDDYAYVQNKTAMQMTSIVDPYTTSNGTLNPEFLLNQSNYKVRFKLEEKLPGDLNPTLFPGIVKKYIDTQTWQLYFKLFINLRSPSENFHEYISGYADINQSEATMGLEKDASGLYAFGYFHIKPEDNKHPFSVRAWQHLRTNQPELANSGRTLRQTNSTSERVNQIKSLGSMGAQIRQMFEGFNNYCNSKNWGKEVLASKSWIRLNSPDKIKYGGGLRVKQITMKDNWAHDEEGTYGQVYRYTMEENGSVISSGVASYEPFVGGDENAMRYAKKYVQTIPLRSDNNLFFEYPVNESNYPGPQVGYRKVTVMSLAAAKLAGNVTVNMHGTDFFPVGHDGFGTSGKTEHEFFTAKEFPVITDETEKKDLTYKLSRLIPFLGSIQINKLTASQGYSIITNDMHGKLKQVSNYRQSKAGLFEDQPISWVRYNYLCEDKVINGSRVKNLVNVFKDNGDQTLSPATKADLNDPLVSVFNLAQEIEMVHDMREYVDETWDGGVRFNKDIVMIPIIFGVIPIPVPTAWPAIGSSLNQLRVTSTNKIIFRAGILESVEAFDGGSHITTKNLKWDKQTGAVVLTSVNNNFDDPVYSYTRLAYHEYQGMGAAYKNTGLSFSINTVQVDPYDPKQYTFIRSSVLASNTFATGDEFLLFGAGSSTAPLAKVVYIGKRNGEDVLYSNTPLTATAYNGLVVRSGFRNQLNMAAGSITALEDPTKAGPQSAYEVTLSIPNK